MTDTTNIATTNPSKTATATILPNAKATIEGQNGINADVSAVEDESLFESMLKMFDGSENNDETLGSETGGNDLPILLDSTELTAEDDRKQLTTSLNLSLQSSLDADSSLNSGEQSLVALANQPISLSIDSEITNKPEANLLSSSIRQLLKLEPENQQQNVQLNNAKLTSINHMTDNDLLQQADVLQLNTDSLELSALKGRLPGSVTQQVFITPEIQSALLQQTPSANVESRADTLSTLHIPLTGSNATGSIATANLQPLPQSEITEPFGRPAWSQGMGKQILWMVNQNISSAEIRLNPAHLGPVEVRLEINDDQITVALSSRHAVVREAMEMALPKLREMFDGNGLSLADTDISQQSFAEQREQTASNEHSNVINVNAEQGDVVQSEDTIIKHTASEIGMVDYYI